MTSLLLHWMPACVVWTLRWYPHRSARLNFGAKSEGCQADWHHGSLLQLVLIPFLPYLAWAAAYYVKVRAPPGTLASDVTAGSRVHVIPSWHGRFAH